MFHHYNAARDAAAPLAALDGEQGAGLNAASPLSVAQKQRQRQIEQDAAAGQFDGVGDGQGPFVQTRRTIHRGLAHNDAADPTAHRQGTAAGLTVAGGHALAVNRHEYDEEDAAAAMYPEDPLGLQLDEDGFPLLQLGRDEPSPDADPDGLVLAANQPAAPAPPAAALLAYDSHRGHAIGGHAAADPVAQYGQQPGATETLLQILARTRQRPVSEVQAVSIFGSPRQPRSNAQAVAPNSTTHRINGSDKTESGRGRLRDLANASTRDDLPVISLDGAFNATNDDLTAPPLRPAPAVAPAGVVAADRDGDAAGGALLSQPLLPERDALRAAAAAATGTAIPGRSSLGWHSGKATIRDPTYQRDASRRKPAAPVQEDLVGPDGLKPGVVLTPRQAQAEAEFNQLFEVWADPAMYPPVHPTEARAASPPPLPGNTDPIDGDSNEDSDPDATQAERFEPDYMRRREAHTRTAAEAALDSLASAGHNHPAHKTTDGSPAVPRRSGRLAASGEKHGATLADVLDARDRSPRKSATRQRESGQPNDKERGVQRRGMLQGQAAFDAMDAMAAPAARLSAASSAPKGRQSHEAFLDRFSENAGRPSTNAGQDSRRSATLHDVFAGDGRGSAMSTRKSRQAEAARNMDAMLDGSDQFNSGVTPKKQRRHHDGDDDGENDPQRRAAFEALLDTTNSPGTPRRSGRRSVLDGIVGRRPEHQQQGSGRHRHALTDRVIAQLRYAEETWARCRTADPDAIENDEDDVSTKRRATAKKQNARQSLLPAAPDSVSMIATVVEQRVKCGVAMLLCEATKLGSKTMALNPQGGHRTPKKRHATDSASDGPHVPLLPDSVITAMEQRRSAHPNCKLLVGVVVAASVLRSAAVTPGVAVELGPIVASFTDSMMDGSTFRRNDTSTSNVNQLGLSGTTVQVEDCDGNVSSLAVLPPKVGLPILFPGLAIALHEDAAAKLAKAAPFRYPMAPGGLGSGGTTTPVLSGAQIGGPPAQNVGPNAPAAAFGADSGQVSLSDQQRPLRSPVPGAGVLAGLGFGASSTDLGRPALDGPTNGGLNAQPGAEAPHHDGAEGGHQGGHALALVEGYYDGPGDEWDIDLGTLQRCLDDYIALGM